MTCLAYLSMTLPDTDTPSALLVDDDILIRMDAVEILEQAGFRVLDAEHGDAAFELLKVQHPEIVLLFTDVQMPGRLDGFALAHKVATSWPHISIVVASGHVSPGPGSMPVKARFIAKPFSAELVHSHLLEILPDGIKPEPLKRVATA
jgi:CheY-like chemotaxis protein